MGGSVRNAPGSVQGASFGLTEAGPMIASNTACRILPVTELQLYVSAVPGSHAVYPAAGNPSRLRFGADGLFAAPLG